MQTEHRIIWKIFNLVLPLLGNDNKPVAEQVGILVGALRVARNHLKKVNLIDSKVESSRYRIKNKFWQIINKKVG